MEAFWIILKCNISGILTLVFNLDLIFSLKSNKNNKTIIQKTLKNDYKKSQINFNINRIELRLIAKLFFFCN